MQADIVDHRFYRRFLAAVDRLHTWTQGHFAVTVARPLLSILRLGGVLLKIVGQ